MAGKLIETKKDTGCPHCHGAENHSRAQRKSCKSGRTKGAGAKAKK